MSDPITTTVTQQTISFATEGSYTTLQQAVQKVTNDMTAYLEKQQEKGDHPVVISVSHSCGHSGYIGYHASIVAVIAEQGNAS